MKKITGTYGVILITSLFSLNLSAKEAADDANYENADKTVRHMVRNLSRPWLPNGLPFNNTTGISATESSAGYIDLNNPFFQDLGSNARRCVSCHLPNTGWTITPAFTRAVFDFTQGGVMDDGVGLGAIFRTNDGSNSPLADVSTSAARRKAYSMLLTKGLIRIGIAIPANADFQLVEVDDPYGYASAKELSLFRRPLPATNLGFLSTVMLDGRETFAGSDHCNIPDEGGKCFASLNFDLLDQANSAVMTHAQGKPLTSAQQEAIVTFETSLATAQFRDYRAGGLREAGGRGGAEEIETQMNAVHYGVNDNFGDYQTGAPFNPNVFTLYSRWSNAKYYGQAAIARGEKLFNTRTIPITGVAGLNGSQGSPFTPPFPDTFNGTCTTCHDTPNGGNHSIVAPLNIGVSDATRRTPDMPLYTFQRLTDGALLQSTDPGRALITGKFADIGKFKGPVLRGLAARAPYFHNGSAKDLNASVDFYNQRFNLNFTQQEHDDLVAFLGAL
ncbi:MAG: hypothetical protein ABSB19_02430 [Methylomonas sp.]